jgi:hypothetical protein
MRRSMMFSPPVHTYDENQPAGGEGGAWPFDGSMTYEQVRRMLAESQEDYDKGSPAWKAWAQVEISKLLPIKE